MNRTQNHDDIFPVAPQSQAPDFTLPDARPIVDALVVKIWRLSPMPDQPRSKFDPVILNDIAKTAGELAARGGGIEGTGIIQPLLVRWAPGSLEEIAPGEGTGKTRVRDDYRLIIIAGETRYWGIKQAGLEDVPVIVRDLSKDEAYEYALIENVVRGDLAPLDEARALRAIMNKRGLSIRKAAERIFGDVKKRRIIENRLALLKCDEDVQALIDARADTVSTAQLINKVREPKERKALIHAALDGATFDTINARVKSYQQRQKQTGGSSSSSSPPSTNSSTNSTTESTNSTTYGKDKAPGLPIVPRINVEDALAVSVRHTGQALDAVRMLHEHNQTFVATHRRKLRAQAEEAQRLAGEVVALLDNPPRKK